MRRKGFFAIMVREWRTFSTFVVLVLIFLLFPRYFILIFPQEVLTL